jgi:hypothetical protein
MHVRLGAESHVSTLDDVALFLIADEVLGMWSLLKHWKRESEAVAEGKQEDEEELGE